MRMPNSKNNCKNQQHKEVDWYLWISQTGVFTSADNFSHETKPAWHRSKSNNQGKLQTFVRDWNSITELITWHNSAFLKSHDIKSRVSWISGRQRTYYTACFISNYKLGVWSHECWFGWQMWYIRQYTVPQVWQNMYLYSSNYFGNHFIIAITHLLDLWYMANIPRLRAVSRHLHWPYTTHPRAVLLK